MTRLAPLLPALRKTMTGVLSISSVDSLSAQSLTLGPLEYFAAAASVSVLLARLSVCLGTFATYKPTATAVQIAIGTTMRRSLHCLAPATCLTLSEAGFI